MDARRMAGLLPGIVLGEVADFVLKDLRLDVEVQFELSNQLGVVDSDPKNRNRLLLAVEYPGKVYDRCAW